MSNDAYTDIKADLEAGTFTNYGSNNIPIYIEKKSVFKGFSKNAYINLKGASREPVQTVNGTVLYTKRSCIIEIIGTSTTAKNNIYDDIVNILTATSRGYTLTRGRDSPQNKKNDTLTILVSMLL